MTERPKVLQLHTSRDRERDDLLELIDELRRAVGADELTEFVAVGLTEAGSLRLFFGAKDVIGAIGMFSVGQALLLQSGE
jgi:hypothetical protein